MKKYVTILFAITIAVTAFSQAQSNSNDKMGNKAKIDSVIVIQNADSLATSILKIYDENSMRQTGVPIHISHFDKVYTTNTLYQMVIVSYNFNQQKFYGKNWKQLEIPDSNKFPYSFSVVYDLTCQRTIFIENQIFFEEINEVDLNKMKFETLYHAFFKLDALGETSEVQNSNYISVSDDLKRSLWIYFDSQIKAEIEKLKIGNKYNFSFILVRPNGCSVLTAKLIAFSVQG